MSSDLKIGEYLKQVREERGYTLQDVSDSINVRKGQLRAIEEGQIDELPGKIYGIGFVKGYAAFLELDAEAAANQFKLEHYAQPQAEEAEDVARKKQEEKLIDSEHDNRVPGILVIALAVAFLMACFVGWKYYQSEDTNIQQLLNYIPEAPEQEADTDFVTAPVTPVSYETEGQANTEQVEEPARAPLETETADEEISEDPAPSAGAPEPVETQAAPPASRTESTENAAPERNLNLNETEQLQKRTNNSRVILRAHTDSWVKITDSTGRSLFQKVLRPGDEYFVPNQSGVTMATGNAGGLDIYVDGDKIVPIGRSGDIMRGVSLDPDGLKTRRAQNSRMRR